MHHPRSAHPVRRLDAALTTVLTTAVAIALSIAPAVAAQTGEPQRETARDTTHRTSIAADYEYDSFDHSYDPWRFASVSLGRRTGAGSIIGRVNTANRFGENGVQYEADAYPRLGGNGVYAYLNLGYSSTVLYPRWRSGAELYTNLPNAYEASLGYRQLRFEGATPVTLFTGTIGKYRGNYWFSLRPFFREKSNGSSASATVTARRYYADANNFLGARLGFGNTPTDRVTALELARTSTFSADFHGSRGLTGIARGLFGTWTIGYENEQLPSSVRRNRLNLTAGLRYDF